LDRFGFITFRGKVFFQFAKGFWTKDISREGEEFKKGLGLFLRKSSGKPYPEKSSQLNVERDNYLLGM
jgi:hypothetical protein